MGHTCGVTPTCTRVFEQKRESLIEFSHKAIQPEEEQGCSQLYTVAAIDVHDDFDDLKIQ